MTMHGGRPRPTTSVFHKKKTRRNRNLMTKLSMFGRSAPPAVPTTILGTMACCDPRPRNPSQAHLILFLFGSCNQLTYRARGLV